MIRKIAQKPLIYMNARDMATVANEMARQSNRYALDLMAEGFRSDISAKDIIKATKNINAFNKKGIMTKEGREKLMETIQTIFGEIPQNAKRITIGDFTNKVLACLVPADSRLHVVKNSVKL